MSRRCQNGKIMVPNTRRNCLRPRISKVSCKSSMTLWNASTTMRLRECAKCKRMTKLLKTNVSKNLNKDASLLRKVLRWRNKSGRRTKPSANRNKNSWNSNSERREPSTMSKSKPMNTSWGTFNLVRENQWLVRRNQLEESKRSQRDIPLNTRSWKPSTRASVNVWLSKLTSWLNAIKSLNFHSRSKSKTSRRRLLTWESS